MAGRRKTRVEFVLAALLLAVPAWPQSPATELVKQGTDYLSKGDYAHAIEAYTNAIRLDPGSATAFYGRGYTHYLNQDDDLAIQDYTDAIQLQPNYGQALRERGLAYEDKNEYDLAIQDYTRAISVGLEDSNLLYYRAFDNERRGEYVPAITDLTEVIRRFPRAADAYRNRGLARLYSTHVVEAKQDLRQAVKLDPSGYYSVIWLYIASAKGETAAEGELAENAAKLDLTRWPGPVIQLFLDKSTPEEVLRAASDKEPVKNSDLQCEANFYIAEHRALHGQLSAAMQGFYFASEKCNKNYFLYVPAAWAELKNKWSGPFCRKCGILFPL